MKKFFLVFAGLVLIGASFYASQDIDHSGVPSASTDVLSTLKQVRVPRPPIEHSAQNIIAADQSVTSTEPNDIYTGYTDTTNSFVEDLRLTYFDNIALAKTGDGRRAFRVYTALNVCSQLSFTISALGGVENYFQRSRTLGLDVERIPLLECREIQAALADGKSLGPESEHWLEVADQNGFGPAKLVNNWPANDLSETAYLSAAQMLEENIASREPIVFQHAVKFYQSFHHPDGKDLNQKEMLKWEYLTCETVTTCNSPNLLAYWAQEFGLLDWEQDEISEFPTIVDQTIRENEEFGFSESWLPMHKDRAETADGIDYSEYIDK